MLWFFLIFTPFLFFSDSGTASIDSEVPHTITEWIANGFCTSEASGFGLAEPVELRAFQPFFLSYSLPYSAIREETIPVIVTVFNYLTDCFTVSLYHRICSRYQTRHMKQTHLFQSECSQSSSWLNNELENRSNTGLTWCFYNLLRCVRYLRTSTGNWPAVMVVWQTAWNPEGRVVAPPWYQGSYLGASWAAIIKQKRRHTTQSITRLGQCPQTDSEPSVTWP